MIPHETWFFMRKGLELQPFTLIQLGISFIILGVGTLASLVAFENETRIMSSGICKILTRLVEMFKNGWTRLGKKSRDLLGKLLKNILSGKRRRSNLHIGYFRKET